MKSAKNKAGAPAEFLTNAVMYCAVLITAVLLLRYPEQTASGVERGLELCLDRVIPSLFPLMVLTVLVVECGAAQKLSKPLAPLADKLWSLPGEAAFAALLSMTGGYPAGARAVCGLYEKGALSGEQAKKMALFSFCAGPAFLVGTVGGMLGSSSGGWLLLGVQIIAVPLTGVVLCAGNRKKGESAAPAAASVDNRGGISGAVVASVEKSCRTMLSVCAFVVLFSALYSLVDACGAVKAAQMLMGAVGLPERYAGIAVAILLEVTGGCEAASGAGLPLLSFTVGFGGLSAQLQALSIIEKLHVSKLSFFMARLLQGVISALLTAFAVLLLPDRAIAVSVRQTPSHMRSTPMGAAMLIVMCAMFAMCVGKGDGICIKRRRKRENTFTAQKDA